MTVEPMLIYSSISDFEPDYFIGNVRTWADEASFLAAVRVLGHAYPLALETLRKKWIRLVPMSAEEGWLSPYDAKPGSRGAFEAWHINVEEDVV